VAIRLPQAPSKPEYAVEMKPASGGTRHDAVKTRVFLGAGKARGAFNSGRMPSRVCGIMPFNGTLCSQSTATANPPFAARSLAMFEGSG
jgi:hypothetical protein